MSEFICSMSQKHFQIGRNTLLMRFCSLFVWIRTKKGPILANKKSFSVYIIYFIYTFFLKLDDENCIHPIEMHGFFPIN